MFLFTNAFGNFYREEKDLVALPKCFQSDFE